MYFRNDEQLRALGLLLNARRADPFFLDTAVIESTSAAGLNLYLNANDRERAREVPGYLRLVSDTLRPYQPGVTGAATQSPVRQALPPGVAPDTRGPEPRGRGRLKAAPAARRGRQGWGAGPPARD
jgi:hypothetical protein